MFSLLAFKVVIDFCSTSDCSSQVVETSLLIWQRITRFKCEYLLIQQGSRCYCTDCCYHHESEEQKVALSSQSCEKKFNFLSKPTVRNKQK